MTDEEKIEELKDTVKELEEELFELADAKNIDSKDFDRITQEK